MKTFSAKILIIGINPYILLPEDILKYIFQLSGKNKGPIPVKGKINRKPFIQTLVKYAGKWRLYLNTPMRISAGIDVGDTGKFQITYDPDPRILNTHPKFEKALSKNKKAKAGFDILAPSRQKEIIRYINGLKTEESLERNIQKAIVHLIGNGKFAGRD
jgi:hypothetical protein